MLPAVFTGKPIHVLSGTIRTVQLERLPEILSLKNPIAVQESPDRENIYLQKVPKISSLHTMEIYQDIFKEKCDNLKFNSAT